ncbi:DnaJ-class molecular chaperone [Geminocystis sp. NIES-3708]|uniref:DnaJ domain-containing protein n=1 Tax=Geminocystis sp. NIES-3708 TaxID=1615909 RepID=UPI0005FC8588|nr:DnaJ domain-containing protein [Geminocystis sp. NIES-3708]BAQ60050.1 DnaJ-class molecular chaperone [Geminocystis sp. NIES-3708]
MMISLNKYYKILELPENASKEQIKKAYRQLSKKWHPDNFIGNLIQQNLAKEKFIVISEAYEILINKNDNFNAKNLSSKFKTNIEEDVSKYYYNLGVLAAENEEWEEAIPYFNNAIKIDDTFTEAYFYRAIVLEKQGFNLRAEADYKKFNELKGKINQKKDTGLNIKNSHGYFTKKYHNNYQKNKSNIKNKVIFHFLLIVIIFLLFSPIIYNFYSNFKFLKLFHKYAQDSLTEKDLLPKMQQTFHYYGGKNKAIITGKKFCEFLKKKDSFSQEFSIFKEMLSSDKNKYLIFITENASTVANLFSDGNISSIYNNFKGEINSNNHDGIEAIAWGITFASVKVYCPEYQSIFFLRK